MFGVWCTVMVATSTAPNTCFTVSEQPRPSPPCQPVLRALGVPEPSCRCWGTAVAVFSKHGRLAWWCNARRVFCISWEEQGTQHRALGPPAVHLHSAGCCCMYYCASTCCTCWRCFSGTGTVARVTQAEFSGYKKTCYQCLSYFSTHFFTLLAKNTLHCTVLLL